MDNEQLTAVYQFGGVLGIVLAGGIFAFRWVTSEVARLSSSTTKTTKTDTTVITTDTVAMNVLSGSIEALNKTVIETNMMLRKEIHEREIDDEVERRLRERISKALPDRG